MKPGGIHKRIEGELERLREVAQFRRLSAGQGVSFCSNDYLGLSRDARLREAVSAAVESVGRVGSTGSRLLSGNVVEWERVESEFAEFAGTEAALYFTSGYAANVGLLSALLGPGDVVFSDAANHASLIDGMRLSKAEKVIYPHGDLRALEATLEWKRGAGGARVIVSETTFSMDGDSPDLEAFFALARGYGAELILDEAHSTGVRGPQGRGMAAECGRAREALAVMHACGKALGSAGAFICCSATLKSYLINHARSFIFSTAAPPYLAGQVRAALGLAREADDERAHLRGLSRSLRGRLRAAGFNVPDGDSPIVPVIIGDNAAALRYAEYLQERGFDVRAIRPPTVPEGTSRLRLSLTSNLAAADIEGVAECIIAARETIQQAYSETASTTPSTTASATASR
jgi:8-amino-7-oxononanoate synthase